MIIAIDYDNCYTKDSVLCDKIIDAIGRTGHRAICVTSRHNSEPIKSTTMVLDTYYTDRKAKKSYMDSLGITVDIWIDDNPAGIYQDVL
jgi:hypothetical protein